MKTAHFILVFCLLALASPFAYASDPSPLQDFCVAINDPEDAVINRLGKFRSCMHASLNLQEIDNVVDVISTDVSTNEHAREDYVN